MFVGETQFSILLLIFDVKTPRADRHGAFALFRSKREEKISFFFCDGEDGVVFVDQ